MVAFFFVVATACLLWVILSVIIDHMEEELEKRGK